MTSLIAMFMGPTWGPSGADRTQVGPMLAPLTLLSGLAICSISSGWFMTSAVCYPDDLAGVGISSGWVTANSLCHPDDIYSSILWHPDDLTEVGISSGWDINVIISSGWDTLPFLSHPDEISNFDFPQHAVKSPHKWPVTRKMFPFDDVIMITVLLVSFPAPCPCFSCGNSGTNRWNSEPAPTTHHITPQTQLLKCTENILPGSFSSASNTVPCVHVSSGTFDTDCCSNEPACSDHSAATCHPCASPVLFPCDKAMMSSKPHRHRSRSAFR